MNKRAACAWCGAEDQKMVKLNQATPVIACVDWVACGLREKEKALLTPPAFTEDAAGKQIFPSRREQRN
jgi:hypothetical protein